MNVQCREASKMFCVCREEGKTENRRTCGDQTIGNTNSDFQVKLLHPRVCPVANFRREFDHFDFIVVQKPTQKIMLHFVPAPLHEFHPRYHGNLSLRESLHGAGRLGVSSQAPDQNIGINQHGILAFAVAAPFRRLVPSGLSTSRQPDARIWGGGWNPA